MRRTLLVGLLLAGLGAVIVAAPEPKVTICHVPPGNPDNAHSITIGESAVPAHLANHPGDAIGACATVISGSR